MSPKNKQNSTIIRSVAVNKDLDELFEEGRKRLRLSRSGFYKHAALRLLEQMGLLTKKVEGST